MGNQEWLITNDTHYGTGEVTYWAKPQKREDWKKQAPHTSGEGPTDTTPGPGDEHLPKRPGEGGTST